MVNVAKNFDVTSSARIQYKNSLGDRTMAFQNNISSLLQNLSIYTDKVEKTFYCPITSTQSREVSNLKMISIIKFT